MTLDEAILHAEEVAEEKEKEGKLLCNSEAGSTGCLKCAEEHRQLAEWIKDYKRLLEQEPCDDAISRKQVKSDYADWFGYGYKDNWFYRHLSNIPPVNPQPKTVHCKDCKYFEYDSVTKVDGIKLIFAHEICSRWGDGCKTREDGYCFLFEPQERDVEE